MRRATPPIHPLVFVVAGLAISVPLVGDARRAFAEDTTASRPQDLGLSLQAAELAELMAPRDRWDAAFVVSRVGKDPKKLFDWVRANSFWIPYQGALRGPVGVLMDGRGNSLDRALLLADLLKRAGHNVRLARAALPQGEAVERLDDLVAREATAVDELDVAPRNMGVALNAAAVEFARGPGQAEKVLAQQAKETLQKTAAIEARVGAQTKRLLALAPAPNSSDEQDARFADAVEALQDHWWVQRQSSSGWVDMDVLSPDGDAIVSADSTAELNEVAEQALYHQVTLRVIVEQWQPGSLSEYVAMAQALRPADLIGRSVVLQFWPTAPVKALTPAGRLELKEAKGGEWSAMLFVDSQAVNAGMLQENGNDPDAAAAASGGGFGGGAFGGAFGQSAQKPAMGKSSLSAVWLEYEIRVPGRKPHKIRREIFDLVGPARRAEGAPMQFALTDAQRTKRDQALTMRNEMLLVPTRIAPEFVTHLVSQSLLANRELLTTAMKPTATNEKIIEIGRRSGPTVTSLYGLALSATAGRSAKGQAISTYVDRPMIFTNHSYPKADGSVTEGTDIVANELGVSLAVQDGYALSMAEGVRLTSAESLLQRAPVSGNTADAFAASMAWVTVRAGDEAEIESLKISADAKRRILEDVGNGKVVVAPRAAANASWWRIDPTTGTTLGIGENGWGAVVAEHGSNTGRAGVSGRFFMKAFGRFAHGFVGAYGFCVAPKVVNNLETRGFTSMSLTISNSAGECAAEGVFWGAFATLPLVILTYNRARVPRVREVPPPVELPPTPEPPCPSGTKVMPKRPGAGNTQPIEPVAPSPLAEEGPFQMTPENKAWQREGYENGHVGATAMGNPAIFDFADEAAKSAYNGARAKGMSAAEARQVSKDIWTAAVKQGQGKTLDGIGIGSGQGGKTVEIPAAERGSPFQMTPENKAWHREQYAEGHEAAVAMGDPKIYDFADEAAKSAYNGARAKGMNHADAYKASQTRWNEAVKQGQGTTVKPDDYPYPIGTGRDGKTVEIPVVTNKTAPMQIPNRGTQPMPSVPESSPPPGSPPPGSSLPPGSPPPGSSPPLGSPPPGKVQSPMSTTGAGTPAKPMQSPNASSGPLPAKPAQPAQAPAGGKKIEPISPPKPTPLNELSPQEIEAQIKEQLIELKEVEAPLKESSKVTQKATEAYVRHRANKPNPGRDWPGDPANYDPVTDQKLQNDMYNAQQVSVPLARRQAEALQKIKDLQKARDHQRDMKRAAEHNAQCGGL